MINVQRYAIRLRRPNYNHHMCGSYWRWIVLLGITGLSIYGAEPPIIEVARNGTLEQLQSLIARKEGLHALGSQKQTALHEAAARCNPEAARVLVEAGLDRTVPDDAGRTALVVALNCRDAAVINQLVRHLYVAPARSNAAASDSPPWSLQNAAARGNVNVAEMLLKMGSDVNGVNRNGDRALEVACRKGDARMVGILLKRGADVKLTSSSGTTVLHEAALGGDPQVVELLIRQGAMVDAADQEKAATPLHYAASFGRLEAARMLVQHGADVRRKDRSGRDALALATENGHSDVAQVLQPARGVKVPESKK